MSNQIKNIHGYSVSSFKHHLDTFLNTTPDIPCVANYDNSLENSSHTNIHLFNGVHPVQPGTLIKDLTTTRVTIMKRGVDWCAL